MESARTASCKLDDEARNTAAHGSFADHDRNKPFRTTDTTSQKAIFFGIKMLSAILCLESPMRFIRVAHESNRDDVSDVA